MAPMQINDRAAWNEFTNFLSVSALSLVGGMALVAVRYALTDRFFYYFLIWNLILALVPYGISVAFFRLSRNERSTRNTAGLAILALLWLVFYPNAPYIFTDFIHLVNRTFVRSGTDLLAKDTLIWLDLILCSAFAYMGHTAGLFSIDLILRSFNGFIRPMTARLLVAIAILISGFGIYIGRFVRFNSWDIFFHPLDTIREILPFLTTPRPVLISLSFSFFILITYAAHHIAHRQRDSARLETGGQS